MYKSKILLIWIFVVILGSCKKEISPKYYLANEIPIEADIVSLLDLSQWFLPASDVKDEMAAWSTLNDNIPFQLLSTLVDSDNNGGVNLGSVAFSYKENTGIGREKTTYLIPLNNKDALETVFVEMDLEWANNQANYEKWLLRWTTDILTITNKQTGSFPSGQPMMENENFQRFLREAQTLSFWTTSAFFQKQLQLGNSNQDILAKNYIHQHLSFTSNQIKNRLELVTANGVTAHTTLYLDKGNKRNFNDAFTSDEPQAMYNYTLSMPNKGRSSTFNIALKALSNNVEGMGVDYDALVENWTGELAIASYVDDQEIAVDYKEVKLLAPLLQFAYSFGWIDKGQNPNDFRIGVGQNVYRMEIIPETIFLRKENIRKN